MRRDARETAFQLIFSKLFNDENEFDENHYILLKREEDGKFAKEIVTNFVDNRENLTVQIEDNLVSYELDRVFKVDLALVYMALTEINYLSTPPQVAINEALELAKKFSSAKSAKFINGLISAVLKKEGTCKQ